MAIDTRTVGGWAMGLAGAALAVAVVTAVPLPDPFARTEPARVVPPPVSDLATDDSTSQVAVFAGGCFWGVQGVYQHVTGVTSAVSGYAGGGKGSAHYDVGRPRRQRPRRGGADHLRSAPGQLWRAAADLLLGGARPDPAQSPGAGRRDAVPVDDLPDRHQAGRGGEGLHRPVERRPCLRRPDRHDDRAGSPFYPAEDYHQDYLTLHPDQPYIAINDLPKIAELKRLFPARYRETPVLVRPRRG